MKSYRVIGMVHLSVHLVENFNGIHYEQLIQSMELLLFGYY